MLAIRGAFDPSLNVLPSFARPGRASRPSPHSLLAHLRRCKSRQPATYGLKPAHPKSSPAVILLTTDTSSPEASSNYHAVLTDTIAVLRSYPASACAGGRRGDPGRRPGRR